MRWSVLVSLLGACSFSPGQPLGAGASDRDAAADPDAIMPTTNDSAIDAPPPLPYHLRVATLIDGESYLILHRDTARWQCNLFAAPGRWNGAMQATMLNDIEWYPTWPDVPDAENRDCMCQSSTYTGLPISIPQAPSTVTLTEVQVRRPQFVVQQPAAENDWTLIVAITDYMVGGAADYIVDIDVTVD